MKKFVKNMMGFLFADMSFAIWVIFLICFCYGSINLLDHDFVDYLGYGLSEIVLYYIAITGIWMYISKFKSSLISAFYIAVVGKIIIEFFALINILDESSMMLGCTVLTLFASVLLSFISDVLIKIFKLEYFYGIEDFLKEDEFEEVLFDDEDDEEVEKDGSNDIVFFSKVIGNEYSYKMSYAVNARKILKEHSLDIAQGCDEEEKIGWNQRIEQLANTIEDGANQGFDECIKTYFFAAYYCGDKYGELFAKDKANTYMERLVWKGKFSVTEFNELFEEGTRGLSMEEKCDLFIEVYQLMSDMLKVSNVMEND